MWPLHMQHTNHTTQGEVVVFNINGRDIPIVHRVLKVHERAEQDHIDILTKVRVGL
jgi:signal peptidase